MALQVTNISDALVASLNRLDRLALTDLSTDYPHTVALKRIINSKKTKQEPDGNEFNFNILKDTNGSARHAGLAHVTNVDITNVLAYGKMPWRRTIWNWAVEDQVIQMNSGNSRIIDLAQAQRLAAAADAVKLFERTLWRCPTLAQFETDPVGIPYFVVKDVTDAATDTARNGFNGLLPSNHTTVANLVPATDVSGRYANYADGYTDVTDDDLFTKMRRGQAMTDFEPIVDGIPSNEIGNDYGIYTNYNTRSKFVDAAKSQNDNLGSDVASMEGKVTFMRTPITYVPHLDADTTGPVYSLNWGCLGSKRLKGFWMKESHYPGSMNPNQPTVTFTETMCVWNMYCTNRRKQAVYATATTMPD